MQPPSEAQKQVVKPGILALLSWLPFGVEDAQREETASNSLISKAFPPPPLSDTVLVQHISSRLDSRSSFPGPVNATLFHT